jgi:hypothetical protein
MERVFGGIMRGMGAITALPPLMTTASGTDCAKLGPTLACFYEGEGESPESHRPLCR